MLSSSLDTLLKVAKTTSPQKLFAYDCVTLYKKKCIQEKQHYKQYTINIGFQFYSYINIHLKYLVKNAVIIPKFKYTF